MRDRACMRRYSLAPTVGAFSFMPLGLEVPTDVGAELAARPVGGHLRNIAGLQPRNRLVLLLAGPVEMFQAVIEGFDVTEHHRDRGRQSQ